MAVTFEKMDFPNFRRGWGIPPGCWKSHYMVRQELTLTVRSACGSVEREIDHHGTGFYALWHEGSFDRCKRCQRIRNLKE